MIPGNMWPLALFLGVAGGILCLALFPGAQFGLELGGSTRHLLAFSTLAVIASLLWPKFNPLLLAGLIVSQ